MIQSFTVRKEILEDTAHEKFHFELTFDDKQYQGYYKDGDIDWFQMKPDQQNHDVDISELDAAVREQMTSWLATQN